MVYNLNWSKDAECNDLPTDIFFEDYENSKEIASLVDGICSNCSIQRECLSLGLARKEWGVWGGVYLEGGQISEEFNSHKGKEDWSDLWISLTTLMK